MSHDTQRTFYFSYFHSSLSYGIIFWGNSAYSSNIFKTQKRIIRIIMNARKRDSCHVIQETKNSTIKITTNFFPLLLFVAKDKDLNESNSEIHTINTRFSSDSHTPTANFPKMSPLFWNQKFLITFLLASKIHLMT